MNPYFFSDLLKTPKFKGEIDFTLHNVFVRIKIKKNVGKSQAVQHSSDSCEIFQPIISMESVLEGVGLLSYTTCHIH